MTKRTTKYPVDRLSSPTMAGICIFCIDSEECYSTPKKCREMEKMGEIDDT